MLSTLKGTPESNKVAGTLSNLERKGQEENHYALFYLSS